MKRILVTGSRTWIDELSIASALLGAFILLEMSYDDEFVLVHGGARGADQLSEKVLRSGTFLTPKFTVETHYADWDRYGKRAGFIRNNEMVKAGADVCLAFIHNNSRGATMCANLAEKAGIPVYLETINNESFIEELLDD